MIRANNGREKIKSITPGTKRSRITDNAFFILRIIILLSG